MTFKVIDWEGITAFCALTKTFVLFGYKNKIRVEHDMTKTILILAMFLFVGVSHAEPEETGSWEISVGADSVITFEPEYVPATGYCYGFTVTGHPEKIFVSPVYPGIKLLAEQWQPVGKPPGIYVFVLDLKSEQVELMALERFLELDKTKDIATRNWTSDYKKLACQGKTKTDTWAFPIQLDGKELVATTSFDSKKKQKSTFGIPSIIPFMGRQKWIEKEKPTFSGTLFLEIFTKENPSTPVVQFRKHFRNHTHYEHVSNLFTWAEGVKPPLLVVMESTDLTMNRKGKIFLARPLPSASQ